MKKQVLILPLFALIVVSSLMMVSASMAVMGTVYDGPDMQTSHGVENATVIVTCTPAGTTEINSQVSSTLSATVFSVKGGGYAAFITDSACGIGSTLDITATKGTLTGSNRWENIQANELEKLFDIKFANSEFTDVYLVPEFGFFVGAATILSAVGIFFFVRRQ